MLAIPSRINTVQLSPVRQPAEQASLLKLSTTFQPDSFPYKAIQASFKMNSTTFMSLMLCIGMLLSCNTAQLVTPILPEPVELPSNFKCPRNLIFAFECRCYFNRIGSLEIPEFEEETCASRAQAVADRPSLGFRIARECDKNLGFLDEITGNSIRSATDAIFSACPRVLSKLCPGTPEYKVLECTCFLAQTGKIESNQEFLDNCNTEWGEVTRMNKRIRRRRCKVSIQFRDFVGAILGITGRQCFTGQTQCCSALPSPPSP